jgi:HTH-type transcriptional regulator/antitoxin HipB
MRSGLANSPGPLAQEINTRFRGNASSPSDHAAAPQRLDTLARTRAEFVGARCHHDLMTDSDKTDRDLVAGWLRRARRRADLSQRDLADCLGCSQSRIARAEAGRGDIPLATLMAVLQRAGLRLAVMDSSGTEVKPMNRTAARDQGGRQFPAHLDPQRVDDLYGLRPYDFRYDRTVAEVGYDRRERRDERRRRFGTPNDHPEPSQLKKRRPPPQPCRPPRFPIEECECGPECERECVSECECQCEPIGINRQPFAS